MNYQNTRGFAFLIVLAMAGSLMPACTQSNSPTPPTNTSSSPRDSASPPPYSGVVDRRDCETVAGWIVTNANTSAEVHVELYIDDKLVETLPANNLRPDLVGKMGSGRYGFSFKIPSAYKDAKSHLASVRVAGSNYRVLFLQGVLADFYCKPS